MPDSKNKPEEKTPAADPAASTAAAASDAANKKPAAGPPQPLGDETPVYSLRIAKYQPAAWDTVEVAGVEFSQKPSKEKYTKLQAREYLAAVDPDGRPYLETVA